MEYKKRFLKNSFLYLLAMILPKAVSFFVLPVYTRYLEPEAYGILSITGSIIGVMSVLSAMGLNAFYLRNYAKAEDKKELNGTIFWPMCIWSIIIFAVSTLILPFALRIFKISVPFFPFMFLALLTQLFNSMEIIPMRTYRIRGEVQYYFVRILFKTIISVVLGLTFVVGFKQGILGRYYAELINAIIFAVVFIIYMFKNSHFKINKDLLQEAVRFSLPIVPSDLLLMGTPMIINVIIQRILSLSQLGVYSIGLTISGLVHIVTMSINLTVEPEIYNKANTSEFTCFFTKLKNMMIISVSIISVGAGLFIRDAIMLLLAESYWDSWKVVQIISISYIISALKEQFSQLIIIQGKTKMLSFSNLSYLIIGSVMSIVTLTLWGEDGLGWANIFGMTGSFLVLYLSADKSEFKDLNINRDFFVVVLSLIVLYYSRLFHNQRIIISIIFNTIIFMVYIFVLLKIYKIKINQIFAELIKRRSIARS